MPRLPLFDLDTDLLDEAIIEALVVTHICDLCYRPAFTLAAVGEYHLCPECKPQEGAHVS